MYSYLRRGSWAVGHPAAHASPRSPVSRSRAEVAAVARRRDVGDVRMVAILWSPFPQTSRAR